MHRKHFVYEVLERKENDIIVGDCSIPFDHLKKDGRRLDGVPEIFGRKVGCFYWNYDKLGGYTMQAFYPDMYEYKGRIYFVYSEVEKLGGKYPLNRFRWEDEGGPESEQELHRIIWRQSPWNWIYDDLESRTSRSNLEQHIVRMLRAGADIAECREYWIKSGEEERDLAEKLGVSDKSVSKSENSRGLPDITLLEPIAEAFCISVTELISGNTIHNANVSANMLRSKFYVCPVCGNVIHSMGEAAIHCHGIQLIPLEAEPSDESHMIFIERVEDEYYVRIEHSMTKEHFISFVAAASFDDMQLVKLYPEGNAQARFKIRGVRRIFFFCNRDGLFSIDPVKGIDDKESGYDDSQERRELEKAAKMLFG